ncbi:MAG: hypothetical protein KC636_05490 [Myxococcales bacterium]|nr:hypothetical protein [Myxococcales bacterium]
MADVSQDMDRTRQVVAALRSELADIPATVEATPAQFTGDALTARITRARALADEHAALAVVWIHEEPDQTLQLYILDPGRAEPVARPITLDPAHEEYGVDTIATITRAATLALLRAPREEPPPQAPPQEPPERPEEPPPLAVPPPHKPERRGLVRFSADYTGNNFSPEVPWQSGAHLTIAYLDRVGAYLGVGYQIYAPISVAHPIESGRFLSADFHRHPIHGFLGYHRTWGLVGLEVEAGLLVDPVSKDFVIYCEATGDDCQREDGAPISVVEVDGVTFGYGFAPRLRLLVTPHPIVAIHIGGGVDVFSDTDSRLICDARTGCDFSDPFEVVLLAPHRVRAVASVGILLFF